MCDDALALIVVFSFFLLLSFCSLVLVFDHFLLSARLGSVSGLFLGSLSALLLPRGSPLLRLLELRLPLSLSLLRAESHPIAFGHSFKLRFHR